MLRANMSIHWDEEQRNIIRQYYNNTSNKEILKIFEALGYKRTAASLDSEAHRLGIKKDKKVRAKAQAETIANTLHKKMEEEANKIIRGELYYYMPEHPYCNRKRKKYYVPAKIIIAEEKIGRYLEEGERVLLIDGDENNLTFDNIKVQRYFRTDIDSLELYQDRQNGMEIKDIREKYNISIETYYRKYHEGLKFKWKLEKK